MVTTSRLQLKKKKKHVWKRYTLIQKTNMKTYMKKVYINFTQSISLSKFIITERKSVLER